ncbi:hypothetical protein [Streptomyces roseochromogenus]|uniref:Uncharacterized protein n=1 Tax=Streptomyces roseochromogenus subsp. oscitans DS 12.976 TaxID=1352936 RepID=V6JFX3_STRRC|nr:hypothetical protein [Streptomyces roseochromogenus]EST18071.1 hypothetical protein M878_45750 [Streptomyces roseochromogenus subsp. oscitans DS 12.976]
MPTSLKAFTTCTLASLVMIIAVTVGVRVYAPLWVAWAALAVVNAALLVADRRPRH